MKKTYYIQGVFWKQTSLGYKSNELARETLKEAKIEISNLVTDKLGELIGRLYDTKVLVPLIPIILKRDDSGLKKYVNNLHKGITSENVLDEMTDSEIAKVMLDFFLLQGEWIQSLFGTTIDSKSNLSMKYQTTKNKLMKKLFTVSPAGTSPSVN